MLNIKTIISFSKNGLQLMIEQKSLNHERTVLVGIISSEQNEEKSNEYLDELEFLSFTAGGQVLKRFVQKISIPNPKTFIGSGKLAEVEIFVSDNDVSTVCLLYTSPSPRDP